MTRFLKSHEYARIEGNKAYIGISEYAARQLGVSTCPTSEKNSTPATISEL